MVFVSQLKTLIQKTTHYLPHIAVLCWFRFDDIWGKNYPIYIQLYKLLLDNNSNNMLKVRTFNEIFTTKLWKQRLPRFNGTLAI